MASAASVPVEEVDSGEGRRMRKFREVLNRALDTSCAQAKPSTFETHVPADLRHELGREALEAYRRDMLETLRLNIQDEFSKLCAERMVREKLDALDDILATMPASGDVRDPHPAPCPEGPMVAMLTTAAARKQQELEALEGLLAQLEQDNADSEEALRAMNERAMLVQSQLGIKVKLMESAVAACAEFTPADE